VYRNFVFISPVIFSEQNVLLWAVTKVGVEPTNIRQALDLAALPVCVLGQFEPVRKRGQDF
jgi:hypothetical protein